MFNTQNIFIKHAYQNPQRVSFFYAFNAFPFIEWVSAPYFVIIELRSNGKQTNFDQQKCGEMIHFTLKMSFCSPTN